MSMSNNLLQLIKDDPEHPYKFLDISEDCKQIKNINGQQIVIYAEKQTKHEALSVVLVSNVFLGKQIAYYNTEPPSGENGECYCDIYAKASSSGEKRHIIEVKHRIIDISEKDFNYCVDSAFSQIKAKYTKQGIKNNFWGSVVIMDNEVFINNPIYADMYKNDSKMSVMSDYEIFRKYGFIIITKLYNKDTKEFEKEKKHHFPYHIICEIDNVLPTETDNLTTNKLISSSKIYATLRDARTFPSSSLGSSCGIQNVRDTILFDEPSKKYLMLDMLDTIICGYKERDYDKLITLGKEKDVVLLKESTIIETIAEREKILICYSTLDGAVIDGQNSIDCTDTIIDFLYHKSETKKNTNPPSHYKHMDERLSIKNITTKSEIEDLLIFTQKMRFRIEIAYAKCANEAKEIARGKNHTIQVNKIDLLVSCYRGQMNCIRQILLENGISFEFAKNNSEFAHNKDKIWHTDLFRSLDTYESYKNMSDIKNLFSMKDFWDVKNSNLDKIVKNSISKYVEKISLETEELNKTRNDIHTKSEILKYIESTKTDFVRKREELKKIENDIQNLKDDIELLHVKKTKLSGVAYEVTETQIIINIAKIFLTTREIVKSYDQTFKNKKKQFSVPDLKTMTRYVFGIVVYKNKEDLNSVTQEIIQNTIEKMFIWYKKIKDAGFTMTTFKRTKSDKTCELIEELVTLLK